MDSNKPFSFETTPACVRGVNDTAASGSHLCAWKNDIEDDFSPYLSLLIITSGA